MKVKKLLAVLLSLAMLCGTVILPQAVFAYDEGNPGAISNNRAHLSYYFAGVTANANTLPSDLTEKSVETLAADQVVWVAVQITNATKFSDLVKANDSNDDNGGAKSITFSMNYDKEYLKPVGTTRTIFSSNGELAKAYPKADLGNGVQLVYSLSYDTANPVALSTSSNETSKLTTPANGMVVMQQFSLSADAYNTDPRVFKGSNIKDAPTVYALFGFQVIKTAAVGTKVLEAGLAKDRLIFDIGFNGSDPTAAWNVTQTSGDKDVNLKNYLNLTNAAGTAASDGVVDLFPAPKAVESVTLKSDTAPALNALSESTALTLTNVKLTVKYTSGSPLTEDVTPDSFAYGDAGVTDGSGLTAFTSGSKPSKTTHNGKHLYAIYAKNGTTYSVDLGEMTVKAAKTIASIAVEGTVSDKTYGDKLATTGLTVKATYTDTTDWPTETITNGITWQVVPPTGNAANLDTNKVYPAGNGYKLKATYSGKSVETPAFNIGKKALTIPNNTNLGTATAVKVNATDKNVSGEYSFTTANGMVAGDAVKVGWTAAYGDVSTPQTSVELAATVSSTLSGTGSANYSFTPPTGAKVTGKITDTVTTLESIAIATPPKMTGYTVGDTLDLSALKVTVNTKVDGAAAPAATIDYDAAGLSYKLGDTAITLPYTLKAEDAGKELTVVYTAHGATKEAKVTDKLAVAADAVNEVTIKTQPDDDKMVYEVNGTLDFSQLVVTLGYTKAADEDVNYADFASKGITVTVGDVTVAAGTKATPAMNGKPITVTCNGISANTTKTLTINAAVGATPDPAVAAPDHKTNNIVVTLPADAAELEYAIVAKDAEAPTEFTKSGKDGSVVFSALADGTALAADTEYDVYVRRAASGEVLASAAVKTTVKTFKNKITVLNKNGSELSVGYADDGEIATQNALHEIVEEPSRLQGYFTDADLTNDVVFPLTISADTTLYAKQRTSSGGGSGGGGWASTPTPTLALSHEKVSGHVGETAALRATLKDSTAKITWASDNEAVATVDEEGVVTFVSVGTAKITATAGTLKATAEVEVLEEGVEPPAEESLINEKYTGAYVYGYEDGTFGATREITRAEVVAMVSRLLKNPIDENVEYETNFSDVADGAWYKNYIGFLAQYGIVEGYSDGTFAPANKITRAEMTAILARAAKFQLTGSATSFSDVADGFWAKAYIATMADKGYVNGYEDGTFAPNRNITRAETVAILNRMLDDSEVVGSIVPADVDASYWAYNEIVKAMNDRRLK